MNDRILRGLAAVRAHLDAQRDDDACVAFAQAYAEYCSVEGIDPGDEGPTAQHLALLFAAMGSDGACRQLAMETSRIGKQAAAAGKQHIAVRWFELADAMHGAIGSDGRFPRAANAIEHGIALRVLHRFDEAEDRYGQAAGYMPDGAPAHARIALALASAVLGKETGRRGQAVALLKQLVSDPEVLRQPRAAGWVMANLAITDDMPEGRFERAIARLEQAHALLSQTDGDAERLAEIEHQLALAMELTGDDRARKLVVCALARTAARPNPEIEWRCLELLAWNLWSARHQGFAVALLKLAIDMLQGLWAERLAADATRNRRPHLAAASFVYDSLALMLTQQGRFGERRSVLNLKLAAVAQEGLATAVSSTEDERWAISAFRQALAEQSRRFVPSALLQSVERIAEAMNQREAAAGEAIARLNRQLHAETLQAMPAADRQDTLVLLCMQTDKEVRVALEAAGMPVALGPAVAAPMLNALAHDFLHALVSGETGLRDRRGSEIASLLLEPLLTQAPPGARRLVICAPGPLHGLPWAALPWRGGYLIEHFDLVRASGEGVDLRRTPAAPMRLLAAGCSVPGAEPLPHAAAEVNSLGANQVLGRPQDFTLARLRTHLPGASALHIATHFEADTARLADSRLLLGDGSVVALGDLAQMGMSHLDLLVLSTCESGVASGTMDARAFAVDHLLMAGKLPAVIGMLFPVADQAMAEFMKRFYQCLRRGDDKARALAAVQIDFLNGAAGTAWRAPFFWAAPMLSGNWQGWPAGEPPATQARRSHLFLVAPGFTP